MKLTAKIKLLPTPKQVQALKDTLQVANAACNYISAIAWEKKCFGKRDLQKLAYYDVKSKFKLSAQVVIRCLAKVADSYKLDKATKREFKETGAIAFDSRILRYLPKASQVSIWTTKGRQKIAYVAGEHQKYLLKTQKGESDLCFAKGKFYLAATCDIKALTPQKPKNGHLGVDLGIKQLATTSEGIAYTGEKVEQTRQRYQKLRDSLQSKGTKRTKRKLKQISGRQKRFQKDVNHCIAKDLVATAKAQKKGIAMENLKGLTRNTKKEKRLRKAQRSKHSNWAFYQLRTFVAYKAEKAGVQLTLVNPKYTSTTCTRCGHCEKANRKSRDVFQCKKCNYTTNADYNAAVEIAKRADVKQPHVGV